MHLPTGLGQPLLSGQLSINMKEIMASPHAGIAAALGTLPDIIEPACSPNHRQFFHSFGMFGLVGLGLYKLNQWEPEDGFDEALRFVLMAASGAYLVHLAMDSSTPKSLPLIGKV